MHVKRVDLTHWIHEIDCHHQLIDVGEEVSAVLLITLRK